MNLLSVKQHVVWLIVGGACTQAMAQDEDMDGISDSIESGLLNALSPVWIPGEPQQSPPQDIGWMLTHGYIKWRERGANDWIERFPASNVPAAPGQFVSVLRAHAQAKRSYEYQFDYFIDEYRHSRDPADTLTWSRCVAESRGVYAQVWRLDGARAHEYSVQFYAHFGWNETDTPPGCDAGNHEGDWIGIDFDVDATDPQRPRIIRAVYHNHGRQSFIQSPAGLLFSGTHPLVFLERGTNEPWPNPGSAGYWQTLPPPVVTTNRRLEAADCTGEHESSCNQGYTAVREHEGAGGQFLIPPRNIGRLGVPSPDSSRAFIMEYPGLYGDNWSNGCWIFDFLDTSSPEGPPFGGNGAKMWRREGWSWDGPYAWTNYANRSVVYASASAQPQSGDGSQGMPVRGLSGALPLASSGGLIVLSSGTYAEMPMTIRNPVTIVSGGGTATIAP
ncbi:MAG: hypothetical protein H7210_08865 [Pyrinomonadaceae bacterium]|nr:hypothetical protein [Phycisphaerales bacterium]